MTAQEQRDYEMAENACMYEGNPNTGELWWATLPERTAPRAGGEATERTPRGRGFKRFRCWLATSADVAQILAAIAALLLIFLKG
jgi:hypothetical protein